MIRIFFTGLAIVIDNYGQPIEPGTLAAAIDGSGVVTVSNAGNGVALVATPWQSVADQNGAAFDDAAAVMSYLLSQFAMTPTQRAGSRVAVADPVTVLPSDSGGTINVCKTVPSPTTIALPDDQADGFVVTIKDYRGDAATHNVTVTTSLTIDGESSYTLVNDWQSETFSRTDAGWAII